MSTNRQPSGRPRSTKADQCPRRPTLRSHRLATLLKLGSGLERNTLVDARLQVLDGLFQELDLDIVQLAHRVELGNTLLAQIDDDAKVLEVLSNLLSNGLGGRSVCVEVDVRGGGQSGFSLESGTDDLVGKLGTGLGHGQGGGSGSGLCLDNLVTSELDSVGQGVTLGLVGQDGFGDRRGGLGEEGKDGVSGVSTNDGDGVLGSLGGFTDDAGDKGGSSEAVEGGNTEETEAGVLFSFLALLPRAKTPPLTAWGQTLPSSSRPRRTRERSS